MTPVIPREQLSTCNAGRPRISKLGDRFFRNKIIYPEVQRGTCCSLLAQQTCRPCTLGNSYEGTSPHAVPDLYLHGSHMPYCKLLHFHMSDT